MKNDEMYKVKATTPYYRNSPQQGSPPDGELEAGEIVSLVKQDEGYSQVKLRDDNVVFVVTKELEAVQSARSLAAAANSSSSGHLDEIELKYGGSSLPLSKSTKYVAVKPRAGIEEGALAEMLPRVSVEDKGASLGGFQLVRVEGAAESSEQTLESLRANSAVKTGSHVYHTSEDEVPFVPTGQIYIECEEGAELEDCQKLLEENSLEIVEARGDRELIVQITPRSENPLKVAKALLDSPLIKLAEPDLATPGKIHNFILPSDHRIIDQWHLRNTGNHRGTSLGFVAGADARVVEAWDAAQSIGSPNVVVAVIDDGFDLSHPDLLGTWKIVAPKDFTRNTASPTPDMIGQDWHGTACAGVALGNADGTGIVGAAPRCRFMPVRWGRDLSDGELENWFGYVRAQGAWVVSCSWGALARNFPLSTRAKRAIERCAKEGRDGLGTVICFAAGNENRDVDDAANRSVNGFAIHPNVIAVAASNSRDRKSDYSNFGARISICAPSSGAGGWGITTSDVMGQYTRGGQTFEAGYSTGPYTNEFGGTSSACPLVAGICGLILSVRPELEAVEVRELLESSARKIGAASNYDGNGHSDLFGFGCIDAAAAISALGQEQMIVPFWGQKGHSVVNDLSIGSLTGELSEFYQLYRDTIIEQAIAADHAKNSDPNERPRHFIDLDLYGNFPFSELPEDFDAAKQKFGTSVLIGRGIVPWQIETTYTDLVEAFENKNLEKVLRHSAWLGHYVGDAHVPFHTTANHDGQLTGQKGLHSYFESRLLDKYVRPEEIEPAMASQITDRPHKLAFRWLRESYSYLQALLDADAANGGKTKKRNLRGFATVAKSIAIDRLAKGCSRVGGLWLSAWIEAGRPAVADIVEPVADRFAATAGDRASD